MIHPRLLISQFIFGFLLNWVILLFNLFFASIFIYIICILLIFYIFDLDLWNFRLSFINLKIILLLLNWFPLSNLTNLLLILVWNLITYLFCILPLLFLLLWHYIAFRRLIYFWLTYSINETCFSCLLTYINFPHLKFTIWYIWILFIFLILLLTNVILC